jgi:hypothetical protein
MSAFSHPGPSAIITSVAFRAQGAERDPPLLTKGSLFGLSLQKEGKEGFSLQVTKCAEDVREDEQSWAIVQFDALYRQVSTGARLALDLIAQEWLHEESKRAPCLPNFPPSDYSPLTSTFILRNRNL